MVITRRARPDDLRQVVAFYHDQDYSPAMGREDLMVVAQREGMLCGALRLCEEHGVLVLRGMRVASLAAGSAAGATLVWGCPMVRRCSWPGGLPSKRYAP